MDIIHGSARYSSADNTLIDCLVIVGDEQHPYTASGTDPSTAAVWAALTAGDAGEIAAYIAPVAPPPHADDVIAERERRLALGFDYDFGDGRGIHHIGTTPEDMRKWLDEVTPVSQALINAGNPAGEIGIFTETGPVTVTAAEWQQILLEAGSWRQPIYQASFALQAMDPIPVDYADDERWP